MKRTRISKDDVTAKLEAAKFDEVSCIQFLKFPLYSEFILQRGFILNSNFVKFHYLKNLSKITAQINNSCSAIFSRTTMCNIGFSL